MDLISTRQRGKTADIYGFGMTLLLLMSRYEEPYEVYSGAEEIIEYHEMSKLRNFFMDPWREEVYYIEN